MAENADKREEEAKEIIRGDRDDRLFELVLERRDVGPWVIRGEEVLKSVIAVQKRQLERKRQ